MTDIKENKIDLWILVPVIILMIFSIGAVYSASSYFSLKKYGDPDYMMIRHITRVFIALILIFVFIRIDYHIFRKISVYLYLISVGFLILVYIDRISATNGADRWISIGPVSFQPSDLAKFTLILFISHLLAKKKEHMNMLYRGYLTVFTCAVLVCVLVLFQPNLSTTVIIFATSILMLFLSPVKYKHISYTMLAIVPLIALVVMSNDYQMERFSRHTDYSAEGKPAYQLSQALIGFGTGNLFGVGPGNSIQRDSYLPHAYGDFIFAIIGEEYGFIGIFIIISLFMMIMIRGYRVAKQANNDFGKYLAFGITTLISAYAVINMSVSCGLLPTTGVPIPFISYGGTALIINSVAIGILLNISSAQHNTFSMNNILQNK